MLFLPVAPLTSSTGVFAIAGGYAALKRSHFVLAVGDCFARFRRSQ